MKDMNRDTATHGFWFYYTSDAACASTVFDSFQKNAEGIQVAAISADIKDRDARGKV